MKNWLIVLSVVLLATAVDSNDDCADATTIPIDELPFTTIADTTQATVDFAVPEDNLTNLTCRVSSVSKGVWYRLTGDDTLVEAKVASDDADVAIRTALFVGDACGDWKCLKPGADYTLARERSTPTSTWFARKGENYWLHVTGVDSGDVGLLQLSIATVPYTGTRPENDRCMTAYLVKSFPKTYAGHDLTHAWPSPTTPFSSSILCGIVDSARKLYYSFTSNGTPFNVTLSNVQSSGADVNLEVAVISTDGGCDGTGAQCVDFQDFVAPGDSPRTVRVTPSRSGQQYIVIVAGEGFDDVGTYDLEFTGNELDSTSSARTILCPFTMSALAVSTFVFALL